MDRKYPFKMFVFGVVLNFLLRYFYLFLPGILLCIVGIWVDVGLWIGLAVFGLDLILSIMDQIEMRKTVLSESDDPEFNQMMDAFYGPEGPDAFTQILEDKICSQDQEKDNQDILQKLVVYRILRSSIHDGMTLDEMIDAFAQMCKTSVGDPDDLLFETGTYDFTGEKLFHFSLTRQFQFIDENEYVQLRLNVLYAPSLKTKLLFTTKWGSLTQGDFFGVVRKSRAFRIVKDLPILKVEVQIDET